MTTRASRFLAVFLENSKPLLYIQVLPNAEKLNQSEIFGSFAKVMSAGNTAAALSLASAVASVLNNDDDSDTASNVTDPEQEQKDKEVNGNLK